MSNVTLCLCLHSCTNGCSVAAGYTVGEQSRLIAAGYSRCGCGVAALQRCRWLRRCSVAAGCGITRLCWWRVYAFAPLEWERYIPARANKDCGLCGLCNRRAHAHSVEHVPAFPHSPAPCAPAFTCANVHSYSCKRCATIHSDVHSSAHIKQAPTLT